MLDSTGVALIYERTKRCKRTKKFVYVGKLKLLKLITEIAVKLLKFHLQFNQISKVLKFFEWLQTRTYQFLQ